MCLYDTWTLDLHWRSYGVNRFDENVEEKVTTSMESLYPEKTNTRSRSSMKIGTVHQGSYRRYSKLKSSNSLLELSSTLPVFGVPQSPSQTPIRKSELKSNFPDFETFRREEELAENLIQVKRERARTNVQMKYERERAVRAEKMIEDLRKEVEMLRMNAEEMKKAHNEECSNLRRDLQESQMREEQLKELNREAYNLLILHGFQKL